MIRVYDTPETPGAHITLTKPNIPDCWTPEPVKTVDPVS